MGGDWEKTKWRSMGRPRAGMRHEVLCSPQGSDLRAEVQESRAERKLGTLGQIGKRETADASSENGGSKPRAKKAG